MFLIKRCRHVAVVAAPRLSVYFVEQLKAHLAPLFVFGSFCFSTMSSTLFICYLFRGSMMT